MKPKNPKIYFKNKDFSIRKIPLNWVAEISPDLVAFSGYRQAEPFISKTTGKLTKPDKYYVSKAERTIYTSSDKLLAYMIDLAEDTVRKYFPPELQGKKGGVKNPKIK